MKIAFVCTEKLPVPPVAGGAVQLYIEGVLPYLSRHHDITVFGVKHPSLPEQEEIDGVRYIRVSGESKSEYIRNVKRKLTDDYDLVHIFNRPRWVVSLGRELPQTKFSLSLHNEMFHPEKIPEPMAADCINRVEFITTVSRFIANGVKKLYPAAAEKLHPVYSGVNVDIYKPVFSREGAREKEELKARYGIEDRKVVLFVGRLSVKKGVDKLLHAVKKVMDVRSDVALVVVGSKWYGNNSTDEYSESIMELSKSLKGPIVFTGFLPPPEVPAHYTMGDVFVCPSQWNEPLARVHYEAMAAGLPIITTNRGGNAEVVKGYGNGIVIEDYSNVDAFADQIIRLLGDAEKALEMGQRGRQLAEEKYSWKRVADELLRLIEGVGEKEGQTVAEAPEAIEEQPAEELETIEERPAEEQEEAGIRPEVGSTAEKKNTVRYSYMSPEEAFYVERYKDYLD